ncbi:MAG TPA: alpha-ketoglutarate dehydrogenase [Caldimonas sp.]|nr:alpha-ketoglutarate dehydrogenase [Caldimonas sp.]HEX2542519.1 alpha-ketoglutarate dehydrogenase [Caldimonas sp.]
MDIAALLAQAGADLDPGETAEWCEALDALTREHGLARARFLLDALLAHARRRGVHWQPSLITPYVNTIPLEAQTPFPGDLAMEQRLAALMRWNALAMVMRANRAESGGSAELGGHIASYASAADLFEVGFNHFFRARGDGAAAAPGGAGRPLGPAESAAPGFLGDLVFFQPHSAPGVYARAFLEGRLSADDLAHYRQELSAARRGARGLTSYPHPQLMPDFWQFPTGSMGIGPINAIYQARFMRYLQHRGLLASAGSDAPAGEGADDPVLQRRVWGFFGDGEMDEPESIAALSLAARERLDNCTFVINCNLQRLDGPVRGNGRIVDELESVFAGAGWHVIKCLWSSDWDVLFARDHGQALMRAFAQTVDGQFQTLSAKNGAFNREVFFGQNPELRALVADLRDEDIDRLRRGGHDAVKIHAAFAAAAAHRGQPTVVLAKTMKGYGMGEAAQGRMTTHQAKKLDNAGLLAFRDRFALPLSDADCEALAFCKPAEDSAELKYLQSRRRALSGLIPARRSDCPPVPVPPLAVTAGFALDAAGKEMSTTMVFVRLLGNLLRDPALGPRIVPIVADEARTFGMAGLFRQVGIYAPFGQLYQPEDSGSILSYREAKSGQILEEGITEAGALSSWTAAATAYSTHGLAMLPFYIYYSMFGFQRVGDLIWAAADQRARGFLIGATAGRTTLGGEGLQHQDGSSHLVAATVPNCRAYDPATAGELAVIVDRGMREMLEEQRDVFYYVTAMNENVAQPSLPADAHDGVLRGMYRFRRAPRDGARRVQLLASGAMLGEAVKAANVLGAEHGVAADLWSVTSFSELARAGVAAETAWRRGETEAVRSWLGEQLAPTDGPIVVATDYVRAVPEQVRAFLPAGRRCVTLGTDGFGRSDTRAELRRHFEVDAAAIVQAALRSLG